MKVISWAIVIGCLVAFAGTGADAGCVPKEWAKVAVPERVKTAKRLQRLRGEHIAWGNERKGRRKSVGQIDPPEFTRDPGRVEVLFFVNYAVVSSRCADRPFQSWRASLPEQVDVRVIPTGMLIWEKSRFDKSAEVQHAVFFTGMAHGLEWEVHEAILTRVLEHGLESLDSVEEADALLEKLGIERGTFEKARNSPEFLGWRVWSKMANRRVVSAAIALREKEGERTSVYPMMMINGRLSLATSSTRHPRETFRIANRLIREELEGGAALAHGLTNNEELADWMAPREGEVFRLVSFGRDRRTKGVYNHARKEFWILDDDGSLKRIAPIIGEGDAARVVYQLPGKSTIHHLTWRIARQMVSYEGASGPQRHGAFLLTDFLSAPETHWVGFPFKGREAALAFSADGTVEARNEVGAVFGTWWLEGGKLYVSLADSGIESWPWKEAAAHARFKVPPESVAPWKER